jgi:hypothetical protein
MPSIHNILVFLLSRSFAHLLAIAVALAALLLASPAHAQENPYFVAYDHNLEEPGNLEVETFSDFGTQRKGNNFVSYWTEFEYGATAWWTTEFYIDAQSTFQDSTLYTGFKWENRFRPLKNEHWINPVLYVEYEHINGADKTIKEVEGHDVESDFAPPNSELRQEHKQEIELKLILSSNYKGWNFTENTLAVKNLSNQPWEFGYAIAAARPLALKGASHKCNLCLQHFIAGIEMYGGLGDRYSFGLNNTSQYLAPALAWNLPSGWTFRIEPSFGLNDQSHQFLLRYGVAYEISGFGRMVSQLFTGKQ